jgi:rubrerythrin
MQQKVVKCGNGATFCNTLLVMKFSTMLFVSILVSLAALSASYGYARRDLGAPERPMWATTIEDLKQICALKLASAAQYDHEAELAQNAENRLQMQLYNALAHSEMIHVRNYMRALNKLGSRYVRRALSPEMGAVTTGFAHNIALERYLVDDRHEQSIVYALEDKSNYAARVVAWASGSDVKHILLLEQCALASDGRCVAPSGYAVCPVCGNTSDCEHEDCYCPFCMTPKGDFVRFLVDLQ